MMRSVYIGGFIALGALLQTILHAVVEKFYIDLLVADFDRYSLGMSWGMWFMIHHVASVILLFGGIAFGFWQGKKWWRVMYIEKRWSRS